MRLRLPRSLHCASSTTSWTLCFCIRCRLVAEIGSITSSRWSLLPCAAGRFTKWSYRTLSGVRFAHFIKRSLDWTEFSWCCISLKLELCVEDIDRMAGRRSTSPDASSCRKLRLLIRFFQWKEAAIAVCRPDDLINVINRGAGAVRRLDSLRYYWSRHSFENWGGGFALWRHWRTDFL